MPLLELAVDLLALEQQFLELLGHLLDLVVFRSELLSEDLKLLVLGLKLFVELLVDVNLFPFLCRLLLLLDLSRLLL